MTKGSVVYQDFNETVATLVVILASQDPEIRIEACGRFATLYFDPLVGFLVYNKKFFGNREDAKDLVQDFIFKRLIEKNIVEGFDSNFGGQKRKFRHYLCRSLMWLYQDGQKKLSPDLGLPTMDPPTSDPDSHDLDDAVYEYVLAANLLIQSFLAVKTDCINKNQKDMWDVFSIRVIKQAVTGKKEKHADIAEQLGLESSKRSSHLLESGLRKFKAFASRIIQEAEPGSNSRSPEDLLKVIAKPPIPNFDLCEHLEKLADLSVEDKEVFLFETGEKFQAAAESWLNDREIEPRDEDEQCWNEILSQTIDQYQDFEQNTGSMSLSVSIMMSTSDETLADKIFQPTQSIDALRSIRIASRKLFNNCNDPSGSSMHRTIYALVHASDIIHHHTCISKNDAKSLLTVFESSLSKPWLDEQSRWQLDSAANFLRQGQIPFPRMGAQD